MFEVALKRVLKYEGGYINDPDDTGGKTYKGISSKFHPDWQGWKIIDELSVVDGYEKTLDENEKLNELVEKFYYSSWKACGAENVDGIYPTIAVEYFDSVVNMGQKRAVKLLQKSVNKVLQREFIKEDGILGPVTLQALDIAVDMNIDINFTYKHLRAKKYVKIVQKNPKNLKFLGGWINRALDLA
ncbi:glycoside hydrolase family 108 protein [Hydrogenimonas thermophila]|uniref:Type VI secretion system secreted protein VgrG n=1 Tax=Hydrogenimonas thermophila TaxID=223786 RepID=A0A1I5RTM2_9BACT|nr:glycosyl hydrolase 108 family protein [Hydrogenimonas thermophila]SFP61296.1 type VI secretion system secreted protein VgrG [Hydrogenimonas thermophila]